MSGKAATHYWVMVDELFSCRHNLWISNHCIGYRNYSDVLTFQGYFCSNLTHCLYKVKSVQC